MDIFAQNEPVQVNRDPERKVLKEMNDLEGLQHASTKKASYERLPTQSSH